MKDRNIQLAVFLVMFLSLKAAFAVQTRVELYHITNCNGMVTDMYFNPTVHSEKVASIPAYAKGIKSSSRKRKYGRRYWQKVSWNSKVGWVFANRLKLESITTEISKNK